MIEIEITEDMVKDATKHVLDHKDVVSKIGVHSPKFKIMGALREEVFAKAFPNCVRSNTHDFDFITPDGRTVDVKTTSSKSMPPEFFETGTNKIELLEASNPNSAIAKFIEKRGEGIHHIAFEVENIHAEMKRMESEGFRLLLVPLRYCY